MLARAIMKNLREMRFEIRTDANKSPLFAKYGGVRE